METPKSTPSLAELLVAAAGLDNLPDDEMATLVDTYARFTRDRTLLSSQKFGDSEPAVQFNPASREMTDD